MLPDLFYIHKAGKAKNKLKKAIFVKLIKL